MLLPNACPHANVVLKDASSLQSGPTYNPFYTCRGTVSTQGLCPSFFKLKAAEPAIRAMQMGKVLSNKQLIICSCKDSGWDSLYELYEGIPASIFVMADRLCIMWHRVTMSQTAVLLDWTCTGACNRVCTGDIQDITIRNRRACPRGHAVCTLCTSMSALHHTLS